MARLWSSGFENNNKNANVEWNSVTGAGCTVQSTTIRSGAIAGRITSLASATQQGFLRQFASATANGPYYFRFALNIAVLPSAANSIFTIVAGTAISSTTAAAIKLDNTGALTLFNATSQVGSASSALSTDTWYEIEVWYDKTGGAGAGVLKARINQATEFASATNLTISNAAESSVYGANLASEAQTTGDWFFDDIAINDNTGSFQTTYPGTGRIIHLLPNAAGDANTFATQTGGTAGSSNNFTRVKEVAPDDAGTFNGSNTLNQVDMFNVTDSTSINSVYSTVFYFDGSNGGTLDNENVWTNDANAIDSDTATTASGSTAADQSVNANNYDLNVLQIFGTNATSPGFKISNVQVRLVGVKGSTDGMACAIYDGTPDSVGLTNLLTGTPQPLLQATGTGAWSTCLIPTGGWTLAKVKSLVAVVYNSSGGGTDQIGQVQLQLVGSIDTASKINVVSVGARFRNNVADATTAFKVQVEKTGSGTITQSASTVRNGTAWQTNTTAPSNYLLTTYQDPDSGNWTSTTIDSMQIGYKLTTGGTNRIEVTKVWALVDFTPGEYIEITETSTISATPTIYITILMVSVSDSSAVSDTITLYITILFLSVSDSSIIGESIAITLQSYISTLDSSIVSDAPTVKLLSYINVSDSSTISDTPTISIPAICVLSGTIVPHVNEQDIDNGGKTIILTLTGDTWIAAGAASFDLQRQNIINGLTSAGAEAFGWNNVVKLTQSVTGVVRTSNTVVTITLDAEPLYSITADETITATIPSTALTGGVSVVAIPTFTVSVDYKISKTDSTAVSDAAIVSVNTNLSINESTIVSDIPNICLRSFINISDSAAVADNATIGQSTLSRGYSFAVIID